MIDIWHTLKCIFFVGILIYLAVWWIKREIQRREFREQLRNWEPPDAVGSTLDDAQSQSSRQQLSSMPPPPPSASRLDNSHFAPLSAEEIKTEDSQQRLNASQSRFYFRQDRIPPADDRLTLTTDRGMVSTGLITPEELVKIHQLGAEMDQARSVIEQAAQEARRAVEQSIQDHAEVKRQKKEEARKRKAERQKEIARRKQMDIAYLGRGVSSRLHDRRANVEKLREYNLPVLATPDDIARNLELRISHLRWLTFHNEASKTSHYIRFEVPKKSGGMRQLAAPHKLLAFCQQWMLETILNRLPMHDAAHGFVKERSILTNAEPHVGKHLVLNCDLKDFFPSITFPRIRGAFETMGYSPAAATILALFCTEAPRREMKYGNETYHVACGPRALPQGACTSPALSNYVARRLDSRLHGMATKIGWTYTRYADDLTFSCSDTGEAAEKIGWLMSKVRHIAVEEGFRVNEKKTRVLRPSARQSVTGVVVNRKTSAPRKRIRRIRAILHRAQFEGLDKQNRDNHPNFESWILGNIAWISMLNPQQGAKLRQAYLDLQQ